MPFARAAGILLHPTSLPGPGASGDLGPAAEEFLAALARARQSVWQVLPLGPTGLGHSPYQALSAFAGDPRLVSPARLVADGLLETGDLRDAPDGPAGRADFAASDAWRGRLLAKAWEAFRAGRGAAGLRERFDAFLEREAAWVHDFSLYVAVREARGGAPWMDWPDPLRRREPDAVEAAWQAHAESAERHRFVQFLFDEHWSAVRAQAAELGIAILGDVPIFVALDSVDVWANRELFDLEEDGRPRAIAGVPPDYFSETGQRWGNPLYRWNVHEERGFAWWIARMRASLRMADRVRIDHFRGFESYWAIPADEPTAVNGRWETGPGDRFFAALRDALGGGEGGLPIVAEDLGDVGEAVWALRDRWGLPGMRVLQFAFAPDARTDLHAPHLHVPNAVVYTGTHDNDTTVGWFRGEGPATEDAAARDAQRARALTYLGTDGSEIHWDLVRLAYTSVADTAIVPMQDVLGLDGSARMNVPGRPDGNWTWRLRPGAFDDAAIERLAALAEVTGRAGERAEAGPEGW